MLKITGIVQGKYAVLDTDTGSVKFVSGKSLYLYRVKGGYIEGCHFVSDGLLIEKDDSCVSRDSIVVPEVWRPITCVADFAYDGGVKYEVSNYGQIRRAGYFGLGHKYHDSRVIKSRQTRGSYRVSLSANGDRKDLIVARLVAKEFIANPEDLPDVCHLDGCINNNRVDNLCWGQHTGVVHTETAPVKRTKAVTQFTVEGEIVAEYDSLAEAQSITGFDGSAISRCCRRLPNFNTCGGYVWRFK